MIYATRPGQPQPLGTTVNDDGVNFSILSQHATDVNLLPFADAFRFHGPGTDSDTRRFGHRFNSNKVLIDPTDEPI